MVGIMSALCRALGLRLKACRSVERLYAPVFEAFLPLFGDGVGEATLEGDERRPIDVHAIADDAAAAHADRRVHDLRPAAQ